MDLRETVEDRAFRSTVRSWLDRNRLARIESLEEHRAWHRRLYEAGFVGMGWPRAYGGREARPMEQAIVAEELARADVPGPINPHGIGFIGPAIIVHGSEDQKRRYPRKMLTADELWCQLFSEPNAGSDLAAVQTRAVRQDDHYLISGHKLWTSRGIGADFGACLARTDPTAPKHRGLSCLIVDMRSPGVEVRPLRQITGSAEFCEVYLTDVRVPVENLIGAEGQGWELAQTTLGFERGDYLLARVARHRTNLGRLIEACRELRRDGRRALDDRLVRQRIGRMLAELDVARYASLRLLSSFENGRRPGPAASVDKLSFSEMEKRHQEQFLEILGPYGLVERGLPPGLPATYTTFRGDQDSLVYNFLFSRAGTIGAGTSEIQKNVIGERVLGLPREPRADRLTR